jgi:hypothetical protein
MGRSAKDTEGRGHGSFWSTVEIFERTEQILEKPSNMILDFQIKNLTQGFQNTDV